ncbi:DUF1499 domain-containing protein [Vibrio parahaemolyticus]|uniref:DUF1499 domain-containing protein n=1 Tax=Vibrio mediterranei TaxID=689 RepID=UPI0040686109
MTIARIIALSSTLILAACSAPRNTTADLSEQPCGDNPRCVSTQDNREEFELAPFILTPDATIDQIAQVALSFHRAELADKRDDYLRIEYTSEIFGYIDDMELKIKDGRLIVRSEARIGYYDFKVNRDRVEAFRAKLIETGLVIANP